MDMRRMSMFNFQRIAHVMRNSLKVGYYYWGSIKMCETLCGNSTL